MDASIIVVDDEQDFLETVRRGLIISGFKNVHLEEDPYKAVSAFEKGESYDLALIDITMPGINGIELLEILKNISPNTECIMVTAVDEARVAVECLKKGAYDYLLKPFSKEELVSSINRALERKRLIDILNLQKGTAPLQLKNVEAFKSIITESKKVLRLLKEAELHAASDVPVLITGESGTGKELLARAIHAASPRAKFPFSPVNMAAVTDNLFDAEFFGHVKGAFTGAEKDRMGYLESAHQGTLFLDEIGTLSFELQGKLLRALQDGEYIKLGTSVTRKTDVRFIAATNLDLEKAMAENRFRRDLYYRLRGAWIHLPPLMKRKDDIPLLIGKFLKEFGVSAEVGGIKDDVMDLLMNYDYPGNIRELRSIIHSAVNLSEGRPISTSSLPAHLGKRKSQPRVQHPSLGNHEILPFKEMEKDYILKAYNMLGQNKSKTAEALGIGINTLRRKLSSYGV